MKRQQKLQPSAAPKAQSAAVTVQSAAVTVQNAAATAQNAVSPRKNALAAKNNDRQDQISLVLQGMRERKFQMDGKMPLLRSLEFYGGGNGSNRILH